MYIVTMINVEGGMTKGIGIPSQRGQLSARYLVVQLVFQGTLKNRMLEKFLKSSENRLNMEGLRL